MNELIRYFLNDTIKYKHGNVGGLFCVYISRDKRIVMTLCKFETMFVIRFEDYKFSVVLQDEQVLYRDDKSKDTVELPTTQDELFNFNLQYDININSYEFTEFVELCTKFYADEIYKNIQSLIP